MVLEFIHQTQHKLESEKTRSILPLTCSLVISRVIAKLGGDTVYKVLSIKPGAALVFSGHRNVFFYVCRPTLVLLPGKSPGRRNLVGCSPWGCKESDTTEQLHFHFSLSCIGEGNGNPLQCSCLENPRDGGAWWLPSMGSHRVRHD